MSSQRISHVTICLSLFNPSSDGSISFTCFCDVRSAPTGSLRNIFKLNIFRSYHFDFSLQWLEVVENGINSGNTCYCRFPVRIDISANTFLCYNKFAAHLGLNNSAVSKLPHNSNGKEFPGIVTKTMSRVVVLVRVILTP